MNRGASALAAGALVCAAVIAADGMRGPGWLGGVAGGVVAAAAVAHFAGRRRGAGEVAENKEAAANAGASELRALLDALAEPALAIGESGVCIAVNGAAERFFGAPAGSLVGSPAADFFTRGEAHAALDAAMAAEGTARAPVGGVRLRIMARGVERTCDLTAARVDAALDAPGEPHGRVRLLVTLRDVTELVDAARVKTEFVANASHELRTPLAAIRAGLETLEGAAADDPAMAARVRGMLGAHVGRLEDLVRDLLDLSRVESPALRVRVEALRRAPLIEALRGEFEHVARTRRLTLDFSLEPSLEGAATDPSLVALILRNLVENATKFAYEGSVVAVRGALTRGDGGATLRFEVEDRGAGIPLAVQSRVFERFFQADAGRGWGGEGAGPIGVRRGTGLGLAIVRHAARAMGGRVWLRSVLREGTTVCVEAPSPPSTAVGAAPESGGAEWGPAAAE